MNKIDTLSFFSSPLSLTLIYDSCRDTPPDVIADMISVAKHEPYSLASNYCIGYGTRPSMRSFEKVVGPKSSGSAQVLLSKMAYIERVLYNFELQGLYMRYLLKHLTKHNLSVKSVLDNLYPSLAQVINEQSNFHFRTFF